MTDIYEIFRNFMETGGDVLWGILIVLMLIWVFIGERIVFQWKVFPQIKDQILKDWQARPNKHSWTSVKIRDAIISDAKMQLSKNISIIKTLIALCPLLGLLGTVTGMIAVFDVMAFAGTGNARLMASGISMATIPTMAGMVASLSTLYFSTWLENKAKRESLHLSEAMQ